LGSRVCATRVIFQSLKYSPREASKLKTQNRSQNLHRPTPREGAGGELAVCIPVLSFLASAAAPSCIYLSPLLPLPLRANVTPFIYFFEKKMGVKSVPKRMFDLVCEARSRLLPSFRPPGHSAPHVVGRANIDTTGEEAAVSRHGAPCHTPPPPSPMPRRPRSSSPHIPSRTTQHPSKM
jgi:hypothetical protein